jgi:hypothetical protein
MIIIHVVEHFIFVYILRLFQERQVFVNFPYKLGSSDENISNVRSSFVAGSIVQDLKVKKQLCFVFVSWYV